MIRLLMPRPTTVPNRWWIDEVWWTSTAETVEDAYAQWPFNHGWSASTYSATACLSPDLSARVRKQRDDALRAVAADAL